MRLREIVPVVVVLAASPALAAEGEPWSGKATLGYLATSGNTENSTLNTGFEISLTTDSWVHSARASAINASEDDMTTAEAYDLGLKTERNLTEQDFLFGRLSWRKDRFSGYDTQFSQSIGYGRRFIDTPVHKLNAEIGAGARQSELVDGTTESETILRGGLSYKWKLNGTSEFRQDLAVESGEENTYVESVTALSAKLFGDVSLVASYTVKNNSNVPPLTEKTDTYTALSLEYVF